MSTTRRPGVLPSRSAKLAWRMAARRRSSRISRAASGRQGRLCKYGALAGQAVGQARRPVLRDGGGRNGETRRDFRKTQGGACETDRAQVQSVRGFSGDGEGSVRRWSVAEETEGTDRGGDLGGERLRILHAMAH